MLNTRQSHEQIFTADHVYACNNTYKVWTWLGWKIRRNCNFHSNILSIVVTLKVTLNARSSKLVWKCVRATVAVIMQSLKDPSWTEHICIYIFKKMFMSIKWEMHQLSPLIKDCQKHRMLLMHCIITTIPNLKATEPEHNKCVCPCSLLRRGDRHFTNFHYYYYYGNAFVSVQPHRHQVTARVFS